MQNDIVLTSIRARLKADLAKTLQPGADYAVVDFPDHPNVGDSAIWLGEMVLLEEIMGRPPAYVAKIKDYSSYDLKAYLPEGPILIHGGGNLGDLYPWHHGLRLKVLEDFKDRQIIQLPQSIHYSSEEALLRDRQIFNACHDLTLYVRDENSQALAHKLHDGDAILSPDCAFGLHLQRHPRRSVGAMCLLRTDEENIDHHIDDTASDADFEICDWLNDPNHFKHIKVAKSAHRNIPQLLRDPMSRRLAKYNMFAEGRVERGVRLLSSGDVVITDRLHGHILSTLLSIPNIALDNNYGKIHSYMDKWTKESDIVFSAGSFPEAIEKYKEISGLKRSA